MAHLHSVYDSDTHFSIDPITRAIRNESTKNSLVQYDHNSERFTFELPRYIDGHDMTLCNRVEVHFLNIGVGERECGVYEVDDWQISPDDNTIVICSWLISANATQLAGSLNFLLRFACVTDSTIEYAWHTEIFSGISVLGGISNSEAVVAEFPDVLETWKAEVLAEFNANINEATTAAESARNSATAAGNAADRAETAANSISFHYGVCSTDGATAAKVVSVEGFELKVGAMVTVKFNSTNTVANPTLNVSGTGAYPMIFKGNSIAAYPLFTVGSLEATKLYDFVFTGAGYELVGGLHVDNFADTSKNRNGYVKPASNGDITWTGGVGTVNRADKAVSDEDGNNIKETYATKKELAEQGNAISVGTNLSGKTVEFSQVNGVSGTGYEVMFKAGDDFEIFSEDDYYQVTKDGVTEGHNTGGINPFSYTFPSDKDYIVSVYDENALSAVVKIENITAYITAEAERVAKNVQATRTAKSLVFPVMSDFHLYDENTSHDASMLSARYAGMGICELKKRMHLDFVGYLGDYTWGEEDYTAEQIMKDITAVKEANDTTSREIWCVGNHDLNYGENRDRLLTLDEMYSYIGANSDGVKPYGSIERGYGYLDFENQKIRVIYLNTCDTSDWAVKEGDKAKCEWISPTQMGWLVDTALDFSDKPKPSEWGIVVVSHHPLHYAYNCFGSTMTILEGYKNSTAGTVDNEVDGITHTISFDFTSGEKAEIICNIHGHNHNCGYSKISSTSWYDSTTVVPWLWRLCIPNICANRYNSGVEVNARYGEYDESGNAVSWEKETGTAKATSFCVVNIDRKNKKIYAHIFGAGKDRVVEYGKYVPTNQIPISTDASGAVYNGTGYKASTKISSSDGTDSSGSSVAVGYIPIEEAEGEYDARGEWVLHLKNIAVAPAVDGNTRIAIYAADKSFITVVGNSAFVSAENDTGSGVPVYTVGDDGYLSTIDITGWRYNQQNTTGKIAAFFRICAPGIDGDSIITVNEEIV